MYLRVFHNKNIVVLIGLYPAILKIYYSKKALSYRIIKVPKLKLITRFLRPKGFVSDIPRTTPKAA